MLPNVMKFVFVNNGCFKSWVKIYKSLPIKVNCRSVKKEITLNDLNQEFLINKENELNEMDASLV